MAKEDSDAQDRRSWRARLWDRPNKWYRLGIPTGGIILFILGIGFWNTFNAVVWYSSREGFCISCHVMKDHVYEEYTQTIHFSNRTGVRATCEGCHMPKDWNAKVARKIQATLHEIPHWMLGTIDTAEKFEARRLFLAKRVWTRMKKTDSRTCRNCHELEHMDLAAQARSARSKHTYKRERERGETCIDCHKGIAHKLPEGWEDVEI